MEAHIKKYKHHYFAGLLLAVFFALILVVQVQSQSSPDGGLPPPLVTETDDATLSFTDPGSGVTLTLETSNTVHKALSGNIKHVDMQFGVGSTSSAAVTVSGLSPNAEYHLYRDGYENHEVIMTDASGNCSFTQDTSAKHHVWIQSQQSTKYIRDDATGGDCAHYGDKIGIGIWDPNTKTCTVTQDLTESVEILDSNITLDCAEHSITGTGSGNGIYLNGVDGTTIKNCHVDNFYYGAYLLDTNYNTITNNHFNYGYWGLRMQGATHAVTDNDFSNNDWFGSYLIVDHSDISRNTAYDNSIGGIAVGYYLTDNDVIDNVVERNYWYGFNLSMSESNVINNTARESEIGFYSQGSLPGDTRCCHSNLYHGNVIEDNSWYDLVIEDLHSLNTITNNFIRNTISGSYAVGYRNYRGESNTFYNNYINSPQHFGIMEGDSNSMDWNTEKTPAPDGNIIEGPYFGGNFWAKPDGTGFSQTCTDSDGDYLCDASYTLDSLNIDNYPLKEEEVGIDADGDGALDIVSEGVVGEKIDDMTYRYTNTGDTEGTVQLRDYTITLSPPVYMQDEVEITWIDVSPARHQPWNLMFESLDGDIEIKDNNENQIFESVLNVNDKVHLTANLANDQVQIVPVAGTVTIKGHAHSAYGTEIVEYVIEAGDIVMAVALANGILGMNVLAGAIGEVRVFDPSHTEPVRVHDVAQGTGLEFAHDENGKIAIANTSCTTAPSNMVSWWDGDDVSEDNRDIFDLIGDNDGYLWGDNVTIGGGKVGKAIHFNGTDNIIVIDDDPNFPTSGITIDAWILQGVLSDHSGAIAYKGNVQDGTQTSWLLSVLSNGKLGFIVSEDGNLLSGGRLVTTANPAIVNGFQFYHVAVTFDPASPSSTNMKIYVDGVEVPSNIEGPAVNSIYDSPQGLFIGVQPPRTNFFSGVIDELEIFDRALTSSEIQAINNAGSYGKCKPQSASSVVMEMFDGNGYTVMSLELGGGESTKHSIGIDGKHNLEAITDVLSGLTLKDSSGSALARSMQRLSSGLRINSAKDDAAGLIISEILAGNVTFETLDGNGKTPSRIELDTGDSMELYIDSTSGESVLHCPHGQCDVTFQDGNESTVATSAIPPGIRVGATLNLTSGEVEVSPILGVLPLTFQDGNESTVATSAIPPGIRVGATLNLTSGEVEVSPILGVLPLTFQDGNESTVATSAIPPGIRVGATLNLTSGEVEVSPILGTFTAYFIDPNGISVAHAILEEEEPGEEDVEVALYSDSETGEVRIRAASGTLTATGIDGNGRDAGYTILDASSAALAVRADSGTHELIISPKIGIPPGIIVWNSVDGNGRKVAEMELAALDDGSDKIATTVGAYGRIITAIEAVCGTEPTPFVPATYFDLYERSTVTSQLADTFKTAVIIDPKSRGTEITSLRTSPIRFVDTVDATTTYLYLDSTALFVRGDGFDFAVVPLIGDQYVECVSVSPDQCFPAKVELVTGELPDITREDTPANIQLLNSAGETTLYIEGLENAVEFSSASSDGLLIDGANAMFTAPAGTQIDGNGVEMPSGDAETLVTGELTVLERGEVNGQQVIDEDGDGLVAPEDACPTSSGPAEYQGCPVGDENLVELHIIDQAKRGDCGGAGSCKLPLENALVRVFDRAVVGNASGSEYANVFEADLGRVGTCKTAVTGQCTAGEETTGDYLVIVKHYDAETGNTVYTGLPKDPSDFVDTDGDGLGDLASKDFQFIKVIKKNGTVQWSGGKKTVVVGSQLDVIYPIDAVWDEDTQNYLYPFIFVSDDNWTVDVCTHVPVGYDIVGVYDENGDLVSSSNCYETFVSGETKVAAFDVIQTGSPPEWAMNAKIKVKGPNGKVQNLDLNVPSHVYEKAHGKPFQQ